MCHFVRLEVDDDRSSRDSLGNDRLFGPGTPEGDCWACVTGLVDDMIRWTENWLEEYWRELRTELFGPRRVIHRYMTFNSC